MKCDGAKLTQLLSLKWGGPGAAEGHGQPQRSTSSPPPNTAILTQLYGWQDGRCLLQ